MSDDLERRLAYLERRIAELERRLSELETRNASNANLAIGSG